MPYIGGFPIYVNKCNEVMDNGYKGFLLKAPATNEAQVRNTDRWHVELDMDVLSPAMVADKKSRCLIEGPLEKFNDARGKRVVPVTGDHMAASATSTNSTCGTRRLKSCTFSKLTTSLLPPRTNKVGIWILLAASLIARDASSSCGWRR